MFITYGRGKNSRYGTIFLDKTQTEFLGGIGAMVDIVVDTTSTPNVLKIKKGASRKIIRAFGSVYARINVDHSALPVMKRQHFFQSTRPQPSATLAFNIPKAHRDGVDLKRGSFVRDTSKIDKLPLDNEQVVNPSESLETTISKELYAFASEVKEAYNNFLDVAIRKGFRVTLTESQEDPLMVGIKVDKLIEVEAPSSPSGVEIVKFSVEFD